MKEKKMEIKKDNSRLMWKIIREIAGREKIEEAKIFIEGVYHTAEEGIPTLLEGWKKDVYQKKENKAMENWIGTDEFNGLKKTYKQQTDRERRENRKHQNNKLLKMELEDSTIQEVIDNINQMKVREAAGPDGVKTEILQEIAKDKLIKIFTRSINEVWKQKEVPKAWAEPITKQFRPIGCTSVGGKLAWGLQRENMETH